jgi:hypothetical protein
LLAYEYVRCLVNPSFDQGEKGRAGLDKDGEDKHDHGPNFHNNAIVMHLRTMRDLGFEVRWKTRPEDLPPLEDPGWWRLFQ